MIVVNDGVLIRGNTVLAPKQMPSRETEHNKQKNVHSRKSSKKNVNKKLIIMRNIMIAFIVGIILVWRYCMIYDLQRNLNTTKQNTVTLTKENENLKVELVKYNNIQYIEEVAVNKLNMVTPDRNDAIYANISKNTIISAQSESNDNENVLTALAQKIF
ncbi:MAG: cell division protein FtsL [Clostridiaceae bacterium]